MSERGEIEVLVPLAYEPSGNEMKALTKMAFTEARRLLQPTGGHVVGLAKIARAIAPHGDMALRYTFAAVAPEQTWHQRQSFAVNPT